MTDEFGVQYTEDGEVLLKAPASIITYAIPEGVAEVGPGAFASNAQRHLKQITFPNTLTTIADWAFDDCDKISDVTLHEGVYVIGMCAFRGCRSMPSINLPNSIGVMGRGALSNCTSLTSVTLPGKMTSISESLFYGCENLREINMHDALTEIKLGAFSGCSSLSAIAIPSSVERIEALAFGGCTELRYCEVPDKCWVHKDAFPEECEVLTRTQGRLNRLNKMLSDRAGDGVEVVGMREPGGAENNNAHARREYPAK